MKKKIIGALAAMLLISAAAANAQTSPKIIVDERELSFEDQGPVIMEETNRTLIPLRFVCNAAGAKVDWDGENQKITVTSGDNRNMVILTVGSDEMQLYYYPSVLDVVNDVQKLDQVPIIMNDRTMIPVRAVLEAIGAKVDWDQETQTINVTSRAYVRYLRDMGVEGYEVNYPLSGGNVTFDKAPEQTRENPYNEKEDLPALSLSSDVTEAKTGDTVDVYVNLANIEKFSDRPLYLSTLTLGVIYDHSKLEYKGHAFLDGEEEYKEVLNADNDKFRSDCLKIASVVSIAGSERSTLANGRIAKLSFEVLSDEPSEITLSRSIHPTYGKDTEIGVDFNESDITTLGEANELYIDTTPVVLNK